MTYRQRDRFKSLDEDKDEDKEEKINEMIFKRIRE